MLKLDKIYKLKSKYKEKLLEAMKNYEYGNMDEAITHTEQLSRAGRGDEAAKAYAINFIKYKLTNIITEEDRNLIKSAVIAEYKLIQEQEQYEYDKGGSYITYHQLLYMYMKKGDREELENLNLNAIDGMNAFSTVLYQETYGSGLIEPLMYLNINNIEVHGTRNIKIETNTGIWKTIKDIRYSKDIDIVRAAKKLLSQDDKEDITTSNCEMEGMLANNHRVSIALKPANKENMIFIKKFDAVQIGTMDDLVENGTITLEMKEELEIYAEGRANICFIGGVNSGKTSSMRGFVGLIPDRYKLGIVEDDFETDWQDLFPEKDFVVLKKTEKYSLSDQFVRLLRMNRNILGIGEARGSEVEQWLEAATRGSDGSFMSLHTRTSHDFINNIAWMCLKNGIPVDMRILRYRIASAIDIVVRNWHAPDGSRIIDEVTEIVTIHDNLDVPYKINKIYAKDITTNKVRKVGAISKDLAEKFSYYNVSPEKLKKIGYEEKTNEVL